VAINSSYNIFDKVLISADFIAQGGIMALNLDTDKITSLTSAADLNCKANYFVSKQFSVFLNFNNILSSDYQLYLNYPVRGFQVMGGASWNF
jgi:outer membrane cobalamin receptor